MPVPSFLAGQRLTAALLRQLFENWATYTPVLTTVGAGADPTLGTGSTQAGAWTRQGDTIDWFAYIQFGTSGTNAGSGTYEVTLPQAALSPNRDFVFTGYAELNAAGSVYMRDLNKAGSTTTTQMYSRADPSVAVAHNVPFAWGASNFMFLCGRYRSAT